MANSISKIIKDLIEADTAIMTILNGGVHTRPIVRDQKKDPLDPMIGSTPEAFELISPFRIKRCISIAEGPAARVSSGPPSGMWQFPSLFIRSQPKDTEKAVLEDIFLLLLDMFEDNRIISMPSGTGGSIQIVERDGPIDDRTISGAVVMIVRLQLDGIWRFEP